MPTGKKTASKAGKLLEDPKSPAAVKSVAASDTAQATRGTGNGQVKAKPTSKAKAKATPKPKPRAKKTAARKPR